MAVPDGQTTLHFIGTHLGPSVLRDSEPQLASGQLCGCRYSAPPPTVSPPHKQGVSSSRYGTSSFRLFV